METSPILKLKLWVKELFEIERKESDVRYAAKIFEKALIALIGLICMAVIGAMLRLVLIN